MKTRVAAFVGRCCRTPRFITAISKLALIFSLLFAAAGFAEAATQTTTLTISGQNNVVISGLTISTTSGDCIDIVNSTNVTITASQIGPCGTNNSTANSRGIAITGGGGINIYDNYIHVDNLASSCSDSHDGIYIQSTQGPVAIRGNVLAYNETHIEGFDANDVTVDGNSLINTRGSASCSNANSLQGHGVQFWRGSLSGISNITMTHNYLLDHAGSPYNFTPAQSDGLSCGHVTGCYENNNYVVFDPIGGTVNIAACGIIAESASTLQQLNNVISQTFNGGICASNSDHATISGNKIELKQPSSGSAGGIIVEGDTSAQCHDISTTGNTSYAIQSSGYVQGYWASSNCTTNVTQSNNTLNGSALAVLDPIASTNPPPLIPPLPFACVAPSPYSTQTSAQPCSGSGSGGGSGSGSGSSPPTAALSASPTSITSGQSSTLTWSSTNATSCSGAGFTASGISGSATVTPATTSTYSITCSGGGGSANASATVTVTAPPPPPPTVALTASPTSITSGQSSTLTWSSTNATSCSGTGFSASGISGSATVTPASTSSYSIACSGGGGSANASATVTVTAAAPPPPSSPTVALTASPTTIASGQSSTLTWSSTNATSCSSPNFTVSAMSGSANVTPASTSTYSINCTGSGGSASASASVTVAKHGKRH